MPTIPVSEETAKFLTELQQRLETQDNHGTAAPYYYSVATYQSLPAPAGHTSDEVWWDGSEAWTDAEIRAHVKEEWEPEPDEDGEIDKTKTIPEDVLEQAVQEFKDNCTEYCTHTIREFENVFLTEEGYKEHMRLNRHNYRSSVQDPHFYIRHAFRNPEMDGLLKAVKELSLAIQAAKMECPECHTIFPRPFFVGLIKPDQKIDYLCPSCKAVFKA